MPIDYAAAKALFLEAAAIDDPIARNGLVAERCKGNSELLARVHALLAANDRAIAHAETATIGGSKADSVSKPTGDDSSTGEHADEVIAGKYTLVESIGEGGMGTVWRARQSEPVKRFVAVKLIKAGMDSKQVLARFEAERQALAMMDHPNIAKVLDGGLHEHRPFFVMELVKGVPITDYCDAKKLTPKERLELFVPVCQAIQHAHQKGIIHRDIKPSNVLIALYDDKPVVKVIDFGVAKATGAALTERTIDTGFGGVVGTPQYMSPEQATFNNLDIDTRSDVYALGVLLYELLTGSPPFSKKDLEQRGLLELLRVVREEEPPRPSTKLSTADALPTLSANRGTEPKKLTGLLRNELDWIVMKALEKDRNRRYETANGFAADVLRYLAGEAVLAHPPSAAYRLRKFARKHRAGLTSAAALALLLVAGVAVSTWQAVRATRAEEAARTAEERIRSERDKARQSFDDAKAAEGLLALGIRFALMEWQRAGKAKGPTTAEDFLNSIVNSIDGRVHNLEDNPAAQAGARKLLAWLLEELELHEAAAREYDKQLTLLSHIDPTAESEAIATARSGLGRCLKAQGRSREAEPHLRQALASYQRIYGPEHVNSLYAMRDLAEVLIDVGAPAEAELLLKRALAIEEIVGPNEFRMLDTSVILAKAYEGQRQFVKAESLLRENLQSRQRVYVPDWPETMEAMARLGVNLIEQGKFTEAEPLLRECLAIREKTEPDAWTTFNTQSLLGAALLGQKKFTEAEPLLRKGYESMKAREKTIPLGSRTVIPAAIDRLIEYYAATKKPDDAANWRAEREKYAAPIENGPVLRETK